MILIGTFDWASTRLRGLFACPNCGSTQKFRLRASRPFLTLYFIPVIPIGSLQEFVQCTNCKNSFETSILATNMLATQLPKDSAPGALDSRQSNAPQPAFSEDLLKVIALIMVEDGQVTENEIRIARRLYGNIAEESLTREDLGRVCAFVQQQRLNTLSFLSTARERRSHEEKLLIVQAIFGVAGADGEISPKRLQSLARSQTVLGIDESELQRAISNTSQWLV